MSVDRILVIGLSNIGDAILMSPVVEELHRRFPDAELALLVGERALPLFQDDPRVDQLLCAEEFHGALGRLRMVALVWRLRPGLLIDLRQTMLPLVWKPWRCLRYFRPVPKSVAHTRDRHLWRLKTQLGMWKVESGKWKVDASFPPSTFHLPQSPIWISAQDRAHVEGLLRRWGVPADRPLVVICPGARSHIKRWMADRFAQVADRLIEERRVAVLFSGEPDEGPMIEEILLAMRHRAYSAVGSITIRQLGALMEHAALVITNDSASLHMACAVGAPALAIFGPTDERKYGPTGPQDLVVRRRLFCAPCEQALCRFSHECMRFIPVDEAHDAAVEMLSRRSKPEKSPMHQ
ncbi:MAG: glycosyltransferase family 9 protein [Candidatus Omnitrophica bacterium]|nr:glycosyltransferase family 9 protein [Candidatus Omnitrophota bacterium]